jgi:hypothetical protein
MGIMHSTSAIPIGSSLEAFVKICIKIDAIRLFSDMEVQEVETYKKLMDELQLNVRRERLARDTGITLADA